MTSNPEHVKISDWSEFEDDLRGRLNRIGFNRMILIRNFRSDRIKIALSTGTDRSAGSRLWSESDFDVDHTANPTGKRPDEVVYVHRLNWLDTPFTVLNLGQEYSDSCEDLTASLTSFDAVSVYSSVGLDRKAFNEHWFNRNPLEALLYVYSIEEEDD